MFFKLCDPPSEMHVLFLMQIVEKHPVEVPLSVVNALESL